MMGWELCGWRVRTEEGEVLLPDRQGKGRLVDPSIPRSSRDGAPPAPAALLVVDLGV
jgi:hypothetical protein